jgi:hypothetical protein
MLQTEGSNFEKYYQRSRRRKDGSLAQFSAEGKLDLQSQYADPARGQGSLHATERGLTWEISKLFRTRIDGARWKDMHTFGRSRGTLNIVWTKRDISSGEYEPEMGGALLFDGSSHDAESIADVAFQYLDELNWREPWTDQDGTQWDSMWARAWAS